MNTRILFPLLLAAITVFSACKDDNDDISPDNLSDNIKASIQAMYPNARILEADQENGTTEVDILDGNKKKEVRFNTAGEWIVTEYDVTREEVPAAVTKALSNKYTDPVIDDIDCFETPTGKYYRFEIILNKQEVKVDIQEDGTIA